LFHAPSGEWDKVLQTEAPKAKKAFGASKQPTPWKGNYEAEVISQLAPFLAEGGTRTAA
jgi:hypothetical protein